MTGKLAFDTERDISVYMKAECPHHTATKTWTCPKCQKLHFDAVLSGDDARISTGRPPVGMPFQGERSTNVKPSPSSAASHDLLSKKYPVKEKEKEKPAPPIRWAKAEKKEMELW